MTTPFGRQAVRFRRWPFRFWVGRDGSVAMEFALLCPVLLLAIFSMFQLGMVFTRIVLVDAAAAEVARRVYVGEVSRRNLGPDDIEDIVCETVDPVFSDCRDNLVIELISIDSMADIPDTDAVCVDSPEEELEDLGFERGVGNQVMFLRLCVRAEMLVPQFAYVVRMGEANGQINFISSLSFMNEPFDG